MILRFFSYLILFMPFLLGVAHILLRFLYYAPVHETHRVLRSRLQIDKDG